MLYSSEGFLLNLLDAVCMWSQRFFLYNALPNGSEKEASADFLTGLGGGGLG